MTDRAMVTRLNLLDAHLRSELKLPAAVRATSLEQAVANSAATTDEVLFGGCDEDIPAMSPVVQRLLMSSLQAQVEARLLRDDDSGTSVRAVVGSIRRMKAAPSMQALERQVCAELCATVGYDGAVLSTVLPEGFVPVAAHGVPCTGEPMPRNGCRAEQDCVRFRRIVHAGAADPAGDGYRELLGHRAYLVAPVVAESKVVAVVHVYRAGDDLADGDTETVGILLSVYSCLYERLLNSERVEHLRASIISAAARLTEEADRIAGAAISLDADVGAVGTAAAAFTASLSNRERRVFERMVQGDSNADIARELVVSVETVKTHVKRILRKTGAANRLEAITLYMDARARPTQHSS